MNTFEIKNGIEHIGLRLLYQVGLSKTVSDYLYKKVHGSNINFINPQMLDEKLMVLKHTAYWKNPLISQCADKAGVREYVRNKECEEILTELFGIYDSVEEIDWDTLPNQFALKCSHGCKMNIIVDDKSKFNKNQVFAQLKKWQQEKFGYQTGEWQYLSIKPKIICEKYYGTKTGEFPVDYKMFCMNGQVVCTLVCSERETGKLRLTFMDNEWNRMNIDTEKLDDSYILPKPKNFNTMLYYARILAKDFPFVRVDFYEYDDHILLSELTFTPAFNCMSYISDEGQKILGEQLII